MLASFFFDSGICKFYATIVNFVQKFVQFVNIICKFCAKITINRTNTLAYAFLTARLWVRLLGRSLNFLFHVKYEKS